jgi:hypothetical protein
MKPFLHVGCSGVSSTVVATVSVRAPTGVVQPCQTSRFAGVLLRDGVTSRSVELLVLLRDRFWTSFGESDSFRDVL